MIRKATIEDADEIIGIYNTYVTESTFTFELEKVTTAEMQKRITQILEYSEFVVYEDEGMIIGYAYASKWRTRPAYDHTFETTVYVKDSYHGKGIAKSLYETLLDLMKKRGVKQLIAGISLPNDRSVAFHEKAGFKKVGHFEKVGFKFGKWIDVGFWQKGI